MNFSGYTINDAEKVLDALKKIDNNKKRFLIVLDSHSKIAGTLTDGDLRRALLKGRTVEDPVGDICNKSFLSMSVKDSFVDVVELFKNESIEFLPIADEDGRLFNIILKKAMHTLMLQNIHPDMDTDYLNIDDSLIDFEIFHRPWGFYKTIVLNDMFQSKLISVKPGASLSLQMHEKREEHWIIVSGQGNVRIGDSLIDVKEGSYLFIPKGTKHRIINTSETQTLVFTEVQLGNYFGEDDIIRFEDEYGRA